MAEYDLTRSTAILCLDLKLKKGNGGEKFWLSYKNPFLSMWESDWKPLSNTSEGRSQALGLAEMYAMTISYPIDSTDNALVRSHHIHGVDFEDRSWQKAVCECAVEIERDKAD